MGKHRLAGIREKLTRTDEQLELLEAQWGRFLQDEQPYGIHWQYDPDAPKYFLYQARLLVFKDPPLRLSVLLGEIVHNLRSALDHLACELVEAHGSRPLRKAAWPISLTENDWLKRIEWPRNATGKRIPGPLHGLSRTSDAWAYVKRAQPYQRGKAGARREPLAELNRLSRIDKHSVVHASYVYPGTSVFEMFTWDTRAHFVTGRLLLKPGQPLKHDTPLADFAFARTGPEPNMRVKRRIQFDISFGTPEDAENPDEQGKGTSLSEIRRAVGRVVDDCRIWTG